MCAVIIFAGMYFSKVIDKDYYKNTKPSFSTIEECVSEEIDYYEHLPGDDYELPYYDCAKMLYQHEYNNQIVVFFQSTDSTVWLYVIEKSVNDGETVYKLIHSETVFLYSEDWQEYDNFKYSCTKEQPSETINVNDVINVTFEDKIYYITVVHN